MQVFLTGATGFIGQTLVRAMRRRDWHIRALVRDSDGVTARWLTSQGCTLVPGDVTQVHLNYSSAKAKRELGWQHPGIATMWAAIIPAEQALMASRVGWLNKLRHQALVDDAVATTADI